METYNRYSHCGETFYTGLNIKQIICSECGEQTGFDDIIKTEKPVSDQDQVTVTEKYSSEEELK